MTPLVTNPNGDGLTLVVVDSDQTVETFDGTKIAQVPKVIWQGAQAELANRVTAKTAGVATAQGLVSIRQADLDNDNSILTAVNSFVAANPIAGTAEQIQNQIDMLNNRLTQINQKNPPQQETP